MPNLPSIPPPVHPRFSNALLWARYGVEPDDDEPPTPLDCPRLADAYYDRLAAAAEAGGPLPLD